MKLFNNINNINLRRYKLNKEEKVALKSLDNNLLFKYFNTSENDLKDTVNKCIHIFEKMFNTNLSNIDKTIYKNNISNLEIHFVPELDDMVASYDTYKNRIRLLDNGKYKISFQDLVHELLHMASTKIVGKKIYSGFYIGYKDSDKHSGDGLNEGYTEYLSNKHFIKHDVSYAPLVRFSKALEMVLGESVMEDAYFSADIKNLEKEVLKYSTKESFQKYINYMDVFHEKIYLKETITEEDVLELEKIHNEIIFFLLDIYCFKIKNLVRQNELSMEDAWIEIQNFIYDLNLNLEVSYDNKTKTKLIEVDEDKEIEIIQKYFKIAMSDDEEEKKLDGQQLT